MIQVNSFDLTTDKRARILDAVAQERVRQNQLVLEGKLPYNCASKGVTDFQKLSVLVEELGEVAKEMNEGCKEKMKIELTQTAAVCVAWLESL